MTSLRTVTSLVCLLGLCVAEQQLTPAISTNEGRLRGNRVTTQPEQGVDIYLGIRYAAPPIDSLRFAPPSPPAHWTDVQNKTQHGARCHEKVIPEDPKTPNIEVSEDCLFLDIYSPWQTTEQTSKGNQSVMMFIHGGGFYAGTGALYNFTNVARQGVVVVAINYRLDVFGFLSTGDDVIPGNFGLLDQEAALKWVKENIQHFGGNSADITLFGGSAGAASVSILSLSPRTRGTFQKAIMQSGVALAFWAVETSANNSRDTALGLAGSLNQSCHSNESTELLKCLRALSEHDLIAASIQYQASNPTRSIWGPVIDKDLLPETPAKLVASESRVSIPTLRGYTSEDGSYYVTDPDNNGLTVIEFNQMLGFILGPFFGKNIDKIVPVVAKKYLQEKTESASAIKRRDTLVKILTDVIFVWPTAVEAKRFSQCGGKDSYLYDFAHRPSYSNYSQWQGVVHADEKGFVLGLPQGPDPFSYIDADQQDREVSDLVVRLWTNFAKYGEPTPSAVNNTVWRPYATGDNCDNGADYAGDLYVIKESPEVTSFDRADKVLFWQKTLPDLAKGYNLENVVNSDNAAKSQYVNILLMYLCLVIVIFNI